MFNKNILISDIKAVYKQKGYAFFEQGDYNLNIGGIRAKNRIADSFDDIRFVIYKRSGQWQINSWAQTTDPGLTGLHNPSRKEGCAIMVPGQWRGCYKGGYHKGDKKRWSLLQIKPISVYRDWNKDSILDLNPNSIMTDLFGINIHDPWKDGLEKIGAASEGCQVAERKSDHKDFMDIYDISLQFWPEIVTYTLFDELDFY